MLPWRSRTTPRCAVAYKARLSSSLSSTSASRISEASSRRPSSRFILATCIRAGSATCAEPGPRRLHELLFGAVALAAVQRDQAEQQPGGPRHLTRTAGGSPGEQRLGLVQVLVAGLGQDQPGQVELGLRGPPVHIAVDGVPVGGLRLDDVARFAEQISQQVPGLSGVGLVRAVGDSTQLGLGSGRVLVASSSWARLNRATTDQSGCPESMACWYAARAPLTSSACERRRVPSLSAAIGATLGSPPSMTDRNSRVASSSAPCCARISARSVVATADHKGCPRSMAR